MVMPALSVLLSCGERIRGQPGHLHTSQACSSRKTGGLPLKHCVSQLGHLREFVTACQACRRDLYM